MATATPPVSAKAVYPAEAVAKLFAPPETEEPADKLRRLLHEARTRNSYLHTAGAYDAFTAAIMTRLGFKALYGSGWQLAVTKSMFPDIGIYASHDMLKLVHASAPFGTPPARPMANGSPVYRRLVVITGFDFNRDSEKPAPEPVPAQERCKWG